MQLLAQFTISIIYIITTHIFMIKKFDGLVQMKPNMCILNLNGKYVKIHA